MRKFYKFIITTAVASAATPLFATDFTEADLVTEAVGEVKVYIRNSGTTDYQGNTDYLGGQRAELVFDAATHTVYLRNPQTSLRTPTYIVGTYTDTSMSFTMPQLLCWSSYYYAVGHRLVVDTDKSTDSNVVYKIDDSEPITYTIADDGTISMNSSDEKIRFGYDEKGKNIAAFTNFDVVYIPFTDTAVTAETLPTDFASHIEKWAYINSRGSVKDANVAEYNGKLYISGLDADGESSYIVGDIDGTTATFKRGQYSGMNAYFDKFTYLYGIDAEDNFEDVVFTYSADEGTLACQNSSLIFCGGDFANGKNLEVFTGLNGLTIKRKATSQVGSIATDRTIVSETYTDLSGRTVRHLAAGLYLKTTTYADGTTVTTKHLLPQSQHSSEGLYGLCCDTRLSFTRTTCIPSYAQE
jgi:hypothetical protein